jgi:translation initiation factor 2D
VIQPSSGQPGLYTAPEVRSMLLGYIEKKNLANERERAYVNVGEDNVLGTSISATNVEFMKREELLKRLLEKMQAWYKLSIEGREDVVKLSP